VTFLNNLEFYNKRALALDLNLNLKDHPLSDITCCLSNELSIIIRLFYPKTRTYDTPKRSVIKGGTRQQNNKHTRTFHAVKRRGEGSAY
jgi:hypothetical protein